MCFVELVTLSPDDKLPDKTAIFGPGLNPWNTEFWCWQQCENLLLQVVMLFQIYQQSGSSRSKRGLGAGSDHILSFSWHDEWTALSCGLHGSAVAFQPSALTLQEMQLRGLVSVWKEPFLCEILFPILFLSESTLLAKFSISQRTPWPLLWFYFWVWVIFVPFSFFLSFSWARGTWYNGLPTQDSPCLAAFQFVWKYAGPLLFLVMLCTGIARINPCLSSLIHL